MDARNKAPKKLDLSRIEDPLLSMAGNYIPDTPLAPSSSTPVEGQKSSKSAEDRPTSPALLPQTPPLDAYADSAPESLESSDDEANDEGSSHLVAHTRVYALAEKYDIPALKQLAKNKFEMAMACYYDSEDFAEAIEEVYCSTIDSDRGLRDIVLQTFTCHPQLASTQDVFTVIKETPSLALELFKIERGIPVC